MTKRTALMAFAAGLILTGSLYAHHSYSAYPGASVRDVHSGLALRSEVDKFAKNASELSPEIFAVEFNRLFVSVQNKLGTFGPIPE